MPEAGTGERRNAADRPRADDQDVSTLHGIAAIILSR
jgi:hypothetical protein